MTQTLGAVVVTFNRLAQIGPTVARLLAGPVTRLIVVDNGSTDGTRELLASVEDPRLELILPEANLGGAGGFETGLRRMVAGHDPDWIVVMDDDARPEPGALAAFLAADKGGWDAVAGAVFFPDGRICDMNRPVLNPFWHPGVFLRTLVGGGRGAFHLNDAAMTGADVVPVDGASFVGLFLSRRAVQMAGFPDGRLFLYAEDALYTLGLTRAGGRIGFAPQIRFEHDCTTFAAAPGRFTPVWKAYYYHRNLLYLYRMAAGWLFWPALLVILPRWVMWGRRQGACRGEYFRLLARAVRDGLIGRERGTRNAPPPPVKS